jgi:hypothetical protein
LVHPIAFFTRPFHPHMPIETYGNVVLYAMSRYQPGFHHVDDDGELLTKIPQASAEQRGFVLAHVNDVLDTR